METVELQALKAGAGDSVLSACSLLKSQWPFTHFAPHMPPIFLLNQIYFLLPDRTLVDRELSSLQQSNQVRVFKLNGREGNDLCVVFREDYEASIRAMLNADGLKLLEEEERRMKEIKRPASLPSRSTPSSEPAASTSTSSSSSSALIKSQSTNSSTASTLRFAPWPSSSSSQSITSTTSTPPPMPLPLHSSSSVRSRSSVLSSSAAAAVAAISAAASSASSASRPPLRRRKTASASSPASSPSAAASAARAESPSEPATKKLKTSSNSGATNVEIFDLTDGDQNQDMPGLEPAASVKVEAIKVESKSASTPSASNVTAESISKREEPKLSITGSSPAIITSQATSATSSSSSIFPAPAPSALPPPFSRAPTMQQVLSATEAPQLFLTASGGVNPKLHVPLSDCAFDDRFPDMQQQAEDAEQLQHIAEGGGEEKEGFLDSLSDPAALSSPAITNHLVNAADTNTLLVLYLTRFLPHFHEVSLTQEKLLAMLYSPFQFRFSPTFTADHAISVLLRTGLLLFRSASSYFLAVPSVSRLTHVLRSGRKEICSLVHRRQFHEMPLRELMSKPKLKSSPCRIEFHLREMLGSEEVIEMKHTTIGTIISLVIKK